MPTTRRLDNSLVIPSEIVGNLTATTSTIGNLTVTGTTTTTGNSAVQFSNVTVTGTLGAGTVNATTSSIGNLTVTGTFVNNATTQFAGMTVTGNAIVGGNVVVGGDGIFTGNVRFGNSGTYGLWSNGTIVASGVTVAQGGNTATLGGTGITTSGLLAVGTMTVSGNASVSGNVSVKDINATGNVAVAQNAFVTGNLTVTGTFVNNATTQFAGMTVTGNAIVGGNVVVGGDGIFTGNVRFGNSGTYGLWSNGTIVASGVTVAQGGNTATLGGTGITTSGLLAVGTMTVSGNASVSGNVSVKDINATGNVAVAQNAFVTGNVSATDVNATGNLAVTKFATVTGGITLPGNAAAAFGNVASNAAVVLTTASFANVLLYANTSDTLANVTATGNLILSNNTANQVQCVNYVVPGLAPGVAFSANVGFSFATAGTSGGGDAFCIQMFPSDAGTGPLTANSTLLLGYGVSLYGMGYVFGYGMGMGAGTSHVMFEYISTTAGYYVPVNSQITLSANTVYNFFVGFDGVQTWTYKVSNTTATVTSGTYVDTQALYNMAQATYPTTIRIRSNSNVGISLITANAVSIVANVGSQFGNVSTAGGAFAITNASGAQMMKINSAYPYAATLGVLNANAAVVTGPFGAFGTTYLGNTLSVAGALTASGTTTFSSATTFNAPIALNANIVPNGSAGIVWAGGNPYTMIESYYGATDRYGMGQFLSGTLRLYASQTNANASIVLGRYSNSSTVTATDWLVCNSAGVGILANLTIAANVASSTGNVTLSAQTLRFPGGDIGNNAILVLNTSNQTQNNMINLTGNAIGAATDTYGFGLVPGTLRYNAATGGKHAFYSNTFTCATIQTSGTAIAGNANSEALTVTNSYGTGFTGNAVTLATTTAAGAGFNMLMATANGVKQFRVAGNGATYANGPYSSAGADYAEYFEWADGNPGAEDRRGLTVVLDGGDKIRIATISDAPNDIIGAVSAVPTVLGDSAWSRWRGMYVLDAFGCPTSDLNPAYDPDTEYVPRSERKEWAPIGLMGKLRVLTGRPVGSSWIRMKTDITPGVDVWLVR